MELRLNRTEENVYELLYGDVVLSKSGELSDVLGKAESFAKKYRKKLYISKSAVSDWYAGFPVDREQAPIVFLDPYFQLQAGVTEESATSPYRFVEGPFLTQEDAVEAAFKIAGKQATVVEK